MALPVPNLDDRRFQDLVDDAKRLVAAALPGVDRPQRVRPGRHADRDCSRWMTDQLLYRLNRVPDRHYVKFLELIGVRLFPPTAAARRRHVLAHRAPAARRARSRRHRRSATVRTETEEAVVFSTTADLADRPDGSAADRLDDRRQDVSATTARPLAKATRFSCFADVPQPGDALYIGLTDAGAVVRDQPPLQCQIEGIGVDPNGPPLAWEAWDGDDWAAASSSATGRAASTATAT